MKKMICTLASLAAVSVVSGCASTSPTAEFSKQLAQSARICNADTATVKLETAPSVVIDDAVKTRLTRLLSSRIDEQKKGVTCPAGVKREYTLNTKITRYDEGSRFARFMLAGLGAMHLDGEFSLNEAAAPASSSAEFKLSKTFAWGGLYGAMTSIQDIEPAFAEGVAEAVVAEKNTNNGTE